MSGFNMHNGEMFFPLTAAVPLVTELRYVGPVLWLLTEEPHAWETEVFVEEGDRCSHSHRSGCGLVCDWCRGAHSPLTYILLLSS